MHDFGVKGSCGERASEEGSVEQSKTSPSYFSKRKLLEKPPLFRVRQLLRIGENCGTLNLLFATSRTGDDGVLESPSSTVVSEKLSISEAEDEKPATLELLSIPLPVP